MRFTLVACLLLAFAFSREPDPLRGVDPKAAELYSGPSFRCRDGSNVRARVNDDYCDCPDGSDEPGTAACANGRFFCHNKGHVGRSLASSFVNDGICDCCDGTDEWNSKAACKDVCWEQGAAAREAQAAHMQMQIKGAKLKREYVNTAAADYKTQQQRLEDLRAQVADLKPKKDALQVQKDDAEKLEKIAKARLERLEKQRLAAERAASARNAETAEPTVTVSASPSDASAPSATAGDEAKDDGFADSFENDEGGLEGLELVPPGTEDAAKQGTRSDRHATHDTDDHFYDGDAPLDVTGEDSEDSDDDDGGSTETQSGTVAGEDEESEDVLARLRAAGLLDGPPKPTGVWGWISEWLPWVDKLVPLGPVTDADRLRSEFSGVESQLRDLEQEQRELERKLAVDVGPNREFAALQGQCFSVKTGEYEYELCPFKDASQKSISGHSTTSLGTWGKWSPAYTGMVYENRQTCWGGPARSLTVSLVCGTENKLDAVAEPNKCTYTCKLSTPAACDLAHADFDTKDDVMHRGREKHVHDDSL